MSLVFPSIITNTAIKADVIEETTSDLGITIDNVLFKDGYIKLSDVAAPSNPSAGEGLLYKKTSDDGLFWKPDASGPEVDITAGDLSAAVLLAGRAGGQTISGGTLTGQTLILKPNSVDLGDIHISSSEMKLTNNLNLDGSDIEGVGWITLEHIEFAGTSTTLGNNTFTGVNTNSLFCGASTGTNAAGTDNVGLGSDALTSLTSGGRDNTALGISAGNNITTGDRNVFLGKNTSGGSGGSTTGAVAIGHGATAASGQCVIGDNNFAISDVLPGTTNYTNLGSDGQRWGRVTTADVKTPEISLIGTTSGEISIKAVAATSTYTLTLPPTVGAAGQVMENQGAGVVQWGVPNDVTKLPLAGGTMTGTLNMGSQAITDVASNTGTTSFYEELVDAGTSAWSGPWAAAQTAPYTLTRVGKQVQISVDLKSSAATVSTFITGPTLAAIWRPKYNTNFYVSITNNSVNGGGVGLIDTAGLIKIYANDAFASFTGSGNGGFDGFCACWNLA